MLQSLLRTALCGALLIVLVGGCDSGPSTASDPCSKQNGGCDAHARCTNNSGAVACDCLPGYAGDGTTCTDIDECAVDNGGCDSNATCTNSGGSRACACRSGYEGDGLTCARINRCKTNNGDCDMNASCSQKNDSVICTCREGYTGDGYYCGDVNECKRNNGGCDPNADCVNIAGGRTCTCRSGWSGDSEECHDVNECATDSGGCDENATCVNTPGSRACTCKEGWAGDGLACADVNECLTNNGNCPANSDCTNTVGARTCTCRTGYAADGAFCRDVNECLTNNGGCDVNATCQNTPGNRTCTCKPNYSGDGMTCAFVDPCTAANGGCDARATCSFENGLTLCSCKLGYSGDGKQCADVNECVVNNGGCDAHATCSNTQGSYSCACSQGYTGDGHQCADVNECAADNGGCSDDADCTNTPGARLCTCHAGFSGDGIICLDENECATNNGGCDAHATCTNTPGSRTCACKTGFLGDGFSCSDVNECATNNGGCSGDSACRNLPGGFQCVLLPPGGAGSFVVIAGDAQTPTVGQTLSSPIVVQLLAADGVTPAPNVALAWSVSNGRLNQATANTDANGRATAIVTAGRLAGTSHVQVAVAGRQTLAKILTFTPLPDEPASIALEVPNGSVDFGTTLTIRVVDQFGNPTTTSAAAGVSSVALTLVTSSGNASFGAVTAGSMNVTSFSPPQATVTLANGVFSCALLDTTAEMVQVKIGVATNAPLPFSAWKNQLDDGAESGFPGWITRSTGQSEWSIQKGTTTEGLVAFRTTFAAAQLLAPQNVILMSTTELASGAVTRLMFDSQVQTDPRQDVTNHCQAAANYRVRLATSASIGSTSVAAVPREGYELQANCSTTPSFGSTNGSWTTQIADLTDVLSTGHSFLNFEGANFPVATAPTPTQSSSWVIDRVRVQTLSVPSFTGASTTITMRPGVATNVRFSQNTLATVQYGLCLSGAAPLTIELETLDQHGNPAVPEKPVRVTWSGASSTLQPQLPLSGATVVALVQNGIDIQPAQSKVLIPLPDAAPDTITVTLDPLTSGLIAGPPVTGTGAYFFCHDNGLGGRWSDTYSIPVSNYNIIEAIRACDSYYGRGACIDNGFYAYSAKAATTGGTCKYGSTLGWVSFTFFGNPGQGCWYSDRVNAGFVYNFMNFAANSCTCSDITGQTMNFAIGYAGRWQ